MAVEALILDGKLNIKGITQAGFWNTQLWLVRPRGRNSVDMTFNRADFDVRYGSGSFLRQPG